MIRFWWVVAEHYCGGSTLARRLSAYFAALCLRWVAIMLNEFVPKRWQRRVFASEGESLNEAGMQRLARAGESTLQMVER
jgi:hypothetical protein